MKLIIDRKRCEGHGLCAEAAPELLRLDDNGDLIVAPEEVPPSSISAARAAAFACPVAALEAQA
ncbi:Ferredoxin fas2 [Mycolicibacterium vanbaalenii]|uniref:Ferredoxin fas2 n=1 Tax=Mycolicibacterium vanbaalenii TaxID=110539 RepID=A0A5S9R019_MYCVN|nr:ferredoxin [Mycolicibacterium vanbaalenii]CAA0124846.1 Ferredoxin fas2 [Mycolicibacterium vanbaalenii]